MTNSETWVVVPFYACIVGPTPAPAFTHCRHPSGHPRSMQVQSAQLQDTAGSRLGKTLGAELWSSHSHIQVLYPLSPLPGWSGEFLFELIQNYSSVCKGPGA